MMTPKDAAAASRFITAAISGISRLRKTTISSRNESSDDDADEQRQLVAEHGREVVEDRRLAADQTSTPVPSRPRGTTSSRSWSMQVGRRGVLRRAGRVRIGDRTPLPPAAVITRSGDAGDAVGRSRTAATTSRTRLLVAAPSTCATSCSGPLKPGPKPSASRSYAWRVVLRRRVGACVGRAEAHREERDREDEHHDRRERGDQRGPGAGRRSAQRAQPPEPSLGGQLAAAERCGARLRPSTCVPKKPSSAGSSVIAARTVKRTASARGDGDAVEEAHAEDEHAEQRDAHRDPGEHAPRGRRCRRRRRSACSVVLPRCSPCRWRATMNSA